MTGSSGHTYHTTIPVDTRDDFRHLTGTVHVTEKIIMQTDDLRRATLKLRTVGT
jgi:hypothetical protein